MREVLLFAVLAGVTALLAPAALRFLTAHGMTAVNYAGSPIPVGTGTLVAVAYGLYFTLAWMLPGESMAQDGAVCAAFVLVFAAGWIDDSVGERHVKGFKGHWRSIKEEGTVTTGAVKAAAVGAAALWVVLRVSSSAADAVVDWATIVLAANALNLLDVRPGRAWKSFYASAAAIAVFSVAPPDAMAGMLLPAAAAGLVLLPGDLKGRHMLGDSGANMLGFAVGCALAEAAPFWMQASALAVLAMLHRIAETSSITVWIERHKWIRWFDQVGRI